MGMLVGVVGAHWTAEHHESVVPVDPGLRIGLSVEVHVANAKAALFEQGV